MLDAHDLEEEIEVPGADANEPQQPLEVGLLVHALVQPHDDAAGQLGGGGLEGHDLADDQFGGLAPAVERSLDEADQVVLDELANLGEFLGPEHGRGRAASSPRSVSLAMRVRPDRLFCTLRTWTLAIIPPRMTSVFSGSPASSADAMGRQGLEQGRVASQGMARHVEAERLLLAGQELGVGQLGNVGQVDRGRVVALTVALAVAVAMAIRAGPDGRLEIVEKPALAAAAVVLLGLARLDCARQDRQELCPPGTQRIERPGADQGLGTTAAHFAGRDPLEEIVQALEGSRLLARLDDRLDGLERRPP